MSEQRPSGVVSSNGIVTTQGRTGRQGSKVEDRARSWPLLAAMVVALILGFAAGCGPTGSIETSVSADAGLPWSVAELDPELAAYKPRLFPARQDGEWGFIDKAGRVAIGFQYQDAGGFSDGLACVKVDGLWGYIDESGEMVITPQFSTAYSFHGGLAQVLTPDGLGYMDEVGKLVIPPNPQWEVAARFSEGVAAVSVVRGASEYDEYIDTSGRTVIKLARGVTGLEFREGLAPARDGQDLWGYIDASGEFVIPPTYLSATTFDDGLAVVERTRSEYVIIDRAGDTVAEIQGEAIGGVGVTEGFSDSRVAVLLMGPGPDGSARWGFVGTTGAWAVPAVFTSVGDYRNGLAYVEEPSGAVGYIDLEGNYVWHEK